MDIRKIKKLIELLEESGINELEITEGEESVRISRGGPVQHYAPMQYQAAPMQAAPAPTAAPAAAAPAAAKQVTPTQQVKPAATPASTTANATGPKPKNNPAHGQPHHRCDIKVGDPLPDA